MQPSVITSDTKKDEKKKAKSLIVSTSCVSTGISRCVR